jgi:hypothetical protein
MIKLQVTDSKGQSKQLEAQMWPAHKDSPTWNSVHLRDGRSFMLSKAASTLLRQGATLNVKIGEEGFYIQRLP